MGPNGDTTVWGPGDSSLRDRPWFPRLIVYTGLDFWIPIFRTLDSSGIQFLWLFLKSEEASFHSDPSKLAPGSHCTKWVTAFPERILRPGLTLAWIPKAERMQLFLGPIGPTLERRVGAASVPAHGGRQRLGT